MSEKLDMAARRALTYKDYAALPDDGRRYELHDGEVSITPAPGTRHQRVVGSLYVVLRAHVEERGDGEVFVSPVDCILSGTTVVQPDLVWVDAGRAHLVSERGIEGAPTLAVEILSPFTVAIDRAVKRRLYARHGVPWYWIVDPSARAIDALALRGESYGPAGRLEGARAVALPPFPDLLLEPAAVWRGQGPAR